jgi:hypothetical protein
MSLKLLKKGTLGRKKDGSALTKYEISIIQNDKSKWGNFKSYIRKKLIV